MSGKSNKLKVLCIHGYRQNEKSFKSKLGSFRKFVNKYSDFEFVAAPHIAPPLLINNEGNVSKENDSTDDEQRSWWFNKEDGSFKGTNKSGPAFGFEESLKIIENAWQEMGPFQGLLGFSQGAAMVGLICHLSVKGKTIIKPDFVILSSGFRSGSLVHLNFYDCKIDIPSLHIFGETDEIIPRVMSELLSLTFTNKQVIIHPGGHYFPATVQQKQLFINFFQDRLEDYLVKREIQNSLNAPTITLSVNNAQSSDSE